MSEESLEQRMWRRRLTEKLNKMDFNINMLIELVKRLQELASSEEFKM